MRSLSGPRVRAPQFPARATWIGTAGQAPSLTDLRGRFVLLDFWTFCCANCLHVLDELRPFEDKWSDVLTVVGVHSPKFAHEADPRAVAAAVERYGVHHPVLNDPELTLWRQYAVRAWPTLILLDPEGYVVAQAAGEGQVSALDATLAELVAEHDGRGTLRRGDGPYVPALPQPTTLRFPAKAAALPESILVADAGHHQLVELARDGDTVLRRIGSGRRGDPFAEPNGLTLLPAGTAEVDVVVADTANHVLRGIRLPDGVVTRTYDLPAALAGTSTVTGAIPPVLSPWDVAWWPALGKLVVAAAGVHLLLAVDPVSGAAEILAGTTVEGLKDGPALDGWLAQPSGLAPDGDRLWFVDAESSALRWLTLDGELHTAVGEGLFDFGHVDGPARTARFQHPLGVTLLADGTVAVLDTYNGAVRRYDPAADTVCTLAAELAEPSGAVLVDGELVVVESAAHRLVRPVPRAELVRNGALSTTRPATELAPGAVRLQIRFAPPPGRKLDDRYGPATRLSVTATPPEALLAGAGDSAELDRTLTFAGGVTEAVLHIIASAASCDDDPLEPHPACHLARQDWGVPVRLVPTGAEVVDLVLLG